MIVEGSVAGSSKRRTYFSLRRHIPFKFQVSHSMNHRKSHSLNRSSQSSL